MPHVAPALGPRHPELPASPRARQSDGDNQSIEYPDLLVLSRLFVIIIQHYSLEPHGVFSKPRHHRRLASFAGRVGRLPGMLLVVAGAILGLAPLSTKRLL